MGFYSNKKIVLQIRTHTHTQVKVLSIVFFWRNIGREKKETMREEKNIIILIDC